MEHNFETLTSVLSGLITLPLFTYTEVRSLSVTVSEIVADSDRASAALWYAAGYVNSQKCSGQLLAHLSDTPVVGTGLSR